MPAPGLCDYPGIGGSGAAFGAYHYWCDFPVEANGSHWHCAYGGAMYQGTLGVGILMFNASITTPVGVLEGSCSWRCPDMTLSAAPNPPGVWAARLVPAKCVTVAPNPDVPPPDPEAPPPPLGGLTPAVTNPDMPNPDATVNPH
jgi:hypothetical protein